jgi:hypothetical protein
MPEFSRGQSDSARTAEQLRLDDDDRRKQHWKRWGPYLSERAWGTVREDYSAYGTAWEAVPHDHARSKAYRWNEDGLAGISDRHQKICFALALWNGRDPILKERLFGVLVLPGFNPDSFLHEMPVQISASGISLCAAG